MREPASLVVEIKLYVTGNTPAAKQAAATVRALADKLGSSVVVKIIDVLEDPLAALNDDVYATPAVFRVTPPPVRRMFGKLESVELLIDGLDLETLHLSHDRSLRRTTL